MVREHDHPNWQVSILANAAGVTIHYGHQLYHDRLPLTYWAPEPSWQIAFGAGVSKGMDNHWLDELVVETGVHVETTPVPVTVSLNGQQFMPVADALAYGYVQQELG